MEVVSVYDYVSEHLFVIDTNAEESYFPAKLNKEKNKKTRQLVGSHGGEIETFSREKKALHLGNDRTYTQWFWLARAKHSKQPVLRRDFLDRFDLMVDVGKSVLMSYDGFTVIILNETTKGSVPLRQGKMKQPEQIEFPFQIKLLDNGYRPRQFGGNNSPT